METMEEITPGIAKVREGTHVFSAVGVGDSVGVGVSVGVVICEILQNKKMLHRSLFQLYLRVET